MNALPWKHNYGQPSRAGLTPQMADCLSTILRLTRQGVPPSYEELGASLGLSKGGVNRTLTALKERGYVDWMPGHARSLCVIHEGHDLRRFSTDELLNIKRRVDDLLADRSAV